MFWKTLVKALEAVKSSNFAQKLTFYKIYVTRHQKFLIFCMKLDNRKMLQTIHIWCSEKLLPRPLSGQNMKLCRKSTVFKVPLERDTRFFKFLHKKMLIRCSKTGGLKFCNKINCLFSSVCSKSLLNLFSLVTLKSVYLLFFSVGPVLLCCQFSFFLHEVRPS